MKLYVLDWHGTLTTLGEQDEIKAFIDALHARGDYTIGYSGSLPKFARGWFTFGNTSKNADHICDMMAVGDRIEQACSRALDPRDRHLPPREQRVFDASVVEEIVVSDDGGMFGHGFDEWRLNFLTRKTGGTPWRYVAPEDLPAELTRGR